MHANEPGSKLQHDLHADTNLKTNVIEPWLIYPQKGDRRHHRMKGRGRLTVHSLPFPWVGIDTFSFFATPPDGYGLASLGGKRAFLPDRCAFLLENGMYIYIFQMHPRKLPIYSESI